jgi:hypothetical protein
VQRGDFWLERRYTAKGEITPGCNVAKLKKLGLGGHPFISGARLPVAKSPHAYYGVLHACASNICSHGWIVRPEAALQRCSTLRRRQNNLPLLFPLLTHVL